MNKTFFGASSMVCRCPQAGMEPEPVLWAGPQRGHRRGLKFRRHAGALRIFDIIFSMLVEYSSRNHSNFFSFIPIPLELLYHHFEIKLLDSKMNELYYPLNANYVSSSFPLLCLLNRCFLLKETSSDMFNGNTSA